MSLIRGNRLVARGLMGQADAAMFAIARNYAASYTTAKGAAFTAVFTAAPELFKGFNVRDWVPVVATVEAVREAQRACAGGFTYF